jgi:hypothetical protein
MKKIMKIGFRTTKKMEKTKKENGDKKIEKQNEITIYTENSKIQQVKNFTTKINLLLRIFKKSLLVLVMILSHFRSLFFFI